MAGTATEAAGQSLDKNQMVQDYIMHHVLNSHEWALPFVKIHLPPFITLHGLMLVLAAFFLILIFGLLYRKNDSVPSGFTNLLEVLVLFVRNKIAIDNMGEEEGRKFTPLLCSLFFFILIMNLMGLIPIFATATSNINVTAALATITLGVMIGGAIYKNGLGNFLGSFVLHGVPWPVLIILVPIEFLGMFIKAFALTVRLFANMLAGHIVIFSIIGLVITFGAAGLPSVLLGVGIYLLEVFVAFLQAFVFTLLSAMFINQIHHPAH